MPVISEKGRLAVRRAALVGAGVGALSMFTLSVPAIFELGEAHVADPVRLAIANVLVPVLLALVAGLLAFVVEDRTPPVEVVIDLREPRDDRFAADAEAAGIRRQTP